MLEYTRNRPLFQKVDPTWNKRDPSMEGSGFPLNKNSEPVRCQCFSRYPQVRSEVGIYQGTPGTSLNQQLIKLGGRNACIEGDFHLDLCGVRGLVKGDGDGVGTKRRKPEVQGTELGQSLSTLDGVGAPSDRREGDTGCSTRGAGQVERKSVRRGKVVGSGDIRLVVGETCSRVRIIRRPLLRARR